MASPTFTPVQQVASPTVGEHSKVGVKAILSGKEGQNPHLVVPELGPYCYLNLPRRPHRLRPSFPIPSHHVGLEVVLWVQHWLGHALLLDGRNAGPTPWGLWPRICTFHVPKDVTHHRWVSGLDRQYTPGPMGNHRDTNTLPQRGCGPNHHGHGSYGSRGKDGRWRTEWTSHPSLP